MNHVSQKLQLLIKLTLCKIDYGDPQKGCKAHPKMFRFVE